MNNGFLTRNARTTLCKCIALLATIGTLSACKEDAIRGVLVAKFTDGSARFTRKIAISTIDGPLLSLALTTRTRRCELIGPVPAGALAGISDCKEISGVAFLRCEGAADIPTRWQMTSCHSGYGRSLPGNEPAFMFGFSGNAYTAQDQLDLARDAALEAPANDCQGPSLFNPFGECNPPNFELPPKLRETPIN